MSGKRSRNSRQPRKAITMARKRRKKRGSTTVKRAGEHVQAGGIRVYVEEVVGEKVILRVRARGNRLTYLDPES